MKARNRRLVQRMVRWEVTPRTEAIVSAAIRIAAAVPAIMRTTLAAGLLLGWDIAAASYLAWVWANVWPRDAVETEQRVSAFDPEQPALRDLLLLGAAVASLVAVGFVLARAGQSQGVERVFQVALGLASVVLSWAIVHTVYMLRYAHLYYRSPSRDIDFNINMGPAYSDFAYLSFTIGMTFQVSDTPLRSTIMRSMALRHALLSYVFGTGILAGAVNLVASLTSR
jgi:uncharacterized membrane protein